MDQKYEYRYETKRAMVKLRGLQQNKNVQYADAATRILKDRELLLRYVEKRLERKRQAKAKRKFLMPWKKFVGVFRPDERKSL